MPFLPIDGELSVLVREKDWSKTPLGPLEKWPQSLKTAVSILLSSRYAMWLCWGPELTFLYNDTYRPTLGLKHPGALGMHTDEVWSEIWSEVGSLVLEVLRTGESTYVAELLLLLERNGFKEETYHTFSYCPLFGDDGNVMGLFCVVNEETERIVGDRRMTTLRQLGASLAGTTTQRNVLAAVEGSLGANKKDFPFSLLYLYDPEGIPRLACSTGFPEGHPAICGVADAWLAGDMDTNPQTRIVSGFASRWQPAAVPTGDWDREPDQLVFVPIPRQGQAQPAGFLAAAMNPYRQWDESYQNSIQLMVSQIAASLAGSRAYEEEQRRSAGLAELDRAKTAFFSNVSHEFRTPLTLMLGPVEDILWGAGPIDLTAHREQLHLVYRNGKRLQRLVNSLLEFSRLEAGRAQANYEATDLASFTADLASSFRSAMDRAGLRYVVDCSSLTESVYVDRQMWEKVVLNLISNAFKYTLSGTVTVRLTKEEGSAVLVVSDTGSGIPSSELSHIFERFHRVAGALGRTSEGTGIGLTIVQELVRLHGGEISVQSEEGTGSSFRVAIPLGTAHLPVEQSQSLRPLFSHTVQENSFVEEALMWLDLSETSIPSSRPSAAEGLPRVLVADDNADTRSYIVRILGANYAVEAVSNGKLALAAATENLPELILADVMMPEMDGFGLLSALRASPKTRAVPVMLLSARAGEEASVEGLEAGADDYLVKPFTSRELLARVAAHVSLGRARKEMNDQMTRTFEQAPVPICVLRGPELRYELANAPYLDLLSTSDVLGHTFLEVIPELSGAPVYETLRRVRETGESYVGIEELVKYDRDRDGNVEDHWFNVLYHPLRDDDESVSGVIVVASDVTAQRTARLELEAANRELEEFAYVASHDLQEPLRAINIFTQQLIRKCVPAENIQAKQYAAFIHQGVTRMEELIKDLLSYSRTITSEKQVVGSVNLSEALEKAKLSLATQIEECGVTIKNEKLPCVYGDELQMTQVFQNLISNSIKYRRADVAPMIHIRAASQGGEWLVSVEDNGIGFDSQYAERIFGLFKRLHNEDYPGTGLGLAICKRIIERFGGKIWAEGHPGVGASVYFKLQTSSEC